MTTSNKQIKANFISEEWMNLQQSFAKKQYKQQLKNKENTKNYSDVSFEKHCFSANYRKDFEKW